MEKIILVFYINVGNMESSDIGPWIKRIQDIVKNEETIQYFVPTRNGNTRIECLNPKLISQEEYGNVKDLLSRNQKIVDDFMESIKNHE